jgi:hypothetical protein
MTSLVRRQLSLLILCLLLPTSLAYAARPRDERAATAGDQQAEGTRSALPGGGPPRRGIPPQTNPAAPHTPRTHAANYRITAPEEVLAPTGSKHFTFSIDSLEGFSGPVTVEMIPHGQVAVNTKTCPPNTSCPYPSTTYNVPAGGSASDEVIASLTGPDGGHIEIFTTSPSLPPKSKFVFVFSGTYPWSISAEPSSLSIPAGQSGVFNVRLTRDGSTADVVVDATGPAGWTVTPARVTFTGAETTKPVTVSVPAGATVGSTSPISLDATSPAEGGSQIVQVPVTVTAPAPAPDFTFSVSPNSVAVTQGGTAVATAAIVRSGGFNGEVVVTGSTSATGVHVDTVTIPAGQTTATLTIAATASATTGSGGSITFAATASSIARTQTAVVGLTVNAQQAPPDFSIAVSPAQQQIDAGGKGHLTLTVVRQNFTGPINVTTTPTPGLSVLPASFTISGTVTSQDLEIAAESTAPAHGSITLTASSPGLSSVTRSATAGVQVIPIASGAPVITSLTPSALVTGTSRAVVIVVGRNFSPGAKLVTADPNVVIEETAVRSESTALVRVSVKPLAETGVTPVTIRNANGATSGPASLRVFESGFLGAPLGVTAAAVMSPLGGKIVTAAERPYATGAVATSGSGTITGRWLFDGATFDSFTITVSAGEPAMVTSRVPVPAAIAGPHQIQLVIDRPAQANSAAVTIRVATESASNLTAFAPLVEDSDRAPGITLRWSLVPGARSYIVEVTRDGQPFPARVEAGQRGELKLSARELPADGATVRWRVAPLYCCSGTSAYAGTFTDWKELPETTMQAARLSQQAIDRAIAQVLTPQFEYQVASASNEVLGEIAASRPPDETPAIPVAASANRADWSIVPMITTTYTRGAEDQDGAVQLSGQGDVGRSMLAGKYTTDFTGANVFADHFTVDENRNWIVNVGNASAKHALRPEAIVGYAPPDFLSGAQLVTSALAHGGALARVGSRYGSLAYYSTFTDTLSGVWSGNFGMQQKLDAIAFELPASERFSLRLISMKVEDLPLPSQITPHGEGRSYGILTTYKLTPHVELTAEAARGKGEWDVESTPVEREGNAFRVGVSSTFGATVIAADFNHTDREFSNPGDRGFTLAGIPNRTGGSLTLTRPLGRGTATIGLRHQMQDRDAISARATGLNLSYTLPLTATMTLTTSANSNTDYADGDLTDELLLADRRQTGASATLTETFGRFNLSQTLAHQRLRDRIDSAQTNGITTFSATGGGTVVRNFDLFATATYIRNDADATVGDGDNVTLSLQPAFAIPVIHVSLQPQLSLTRVTNDFLGTVDRGEQLATIVQWAPAWFEKFGALQFSTRWDRTTHDLLGIVTRTTNRSYAGTLTLKWGQGVGADMFRRNRLPGEMPLTGREAASHDPVNGSF